MTIREMTAADIPMVTELGRTSFSDFWNEDMFGDELKKDYSYYYVCEKDGKTAGYIGIWCIYETAELVRVCTSPNARRCGIADTLMNAALEKSGECGCERIMLEVRKSNTAACALYEKYGFSYIGVRKGYYSGGEDALIMEKKLKGND